MTTRVARERLASRAPATRGSLGLLLRLGSWLLVVAFFLYGARYTWLEGYVYATQRGFFGDFTQVARLELLFAWDGTGIYYGPLFVLEWLLFIRSSDAALDVLGYLNYPLFGLAFGCIWLAFFRRADPRISLLVAGAWIAHQGTAFGFTTNAHLEILELLFISLGMLLIVRGAPLGAGASLGLAAMTKVLPGILIPYLLVMRQWRMFLAATAVCGVLFLVVVWIQGLHIVDAAVALLYQKGQLEMQDASPYIQSTTAAIKRWSNALGISVNVLAVHAVFGMLLAAIAVWLLGRRPMPDRMIPVGLGLCLALMLLLTPQAHTSYFILAYPAWAAGAAALLHRPRNRQTAALWAMLVGSYVLNGFHQPTAYLSRWVGFDVATWAQEANLPTLGLLLLFITMGTILTSGSGEVETSPDGVRASEPTPVAPVTLP